MMNELIKVNYDSVNPTVSGRDLHRALGIGTPYQKWFTRMCEYGFRENRDFTLVRQICPTNNPKNPTTTLMDHALTMAMAKELCMIQRSEIGKLCREHFIKIEEAWNSPEMIMKRAYQFAEQRALEAQRRIFALEEDNEVLAIALNESLQFYTVAKYNKTFGMDWDMSDCQRIGKQLSAYCRSRSIEIRRCETNDERFGAVNSYPMTAWEDFLEGGR